MRVLLLTLVIIYHNQNVSCFEFTDVVTKFNEVTSFIGNKLNALATKIKSLLFEPTTTIKVEPVTYTKYKNNKRTRDSYTDFIDAVASDNFTDVPEYMNLRSEPTALMSTTQLATLHGKRVETHRIYTSDGYLLTIHRILPSIDYGSNSTYTHVTNQTVLLHHGLLGSSADWLLLGADKSLPYILSDSGYDVWLMNARGNYYSRGHIRLNVDTKGYWNFSFQEMGEKDLPAVIDYIRSMKNNNDPIDYIGHSLGATSLLVMLSTTPAYNDYLRMGVLFAPLAFMTYSKGPLKFMTTLSFDTPQPILQMMGTTEFLPTRRIPPWLATEYCKGPLLFCSNPLFFITGGIRNETTTDTSFLARLLYHVPAGTSTNTMLHFAQLVKSGKFHKFNDESQEYNLAGITLPIVFFSSSDDTFVNVNDVLRLYFSIPNPIEHYIVREKNVTHNDFVWGENADETIFSKVVEFLAYGLNWIPYKSNEIHST